MKRAPPSGGGEPTFADSPEPTQWITYSQRPKSRSRIKGNFETWTRLGLFTISTPTSHLSLPSTRVAHKVEYEPALLDTQQSDNLSGRRQGISRATLF
jgi:hypothetical protein